MKNQFYSFGEAPAAWRQKETPEAQAAKHHKASAHGMTGMAKVIAMACEKSDGFDPQVSRNGTPQATFGRIHSASEGLPLALADYQTAIRNLADSMLEPEASMEDGAAAAGQAFLGQFIDHDLTLDAMTQLSTVFAPSVATLPNFRTPRLDLDCVYAGGPEVSPHLFDQTKEGRMLFGRPDGEGGAPANDMDLPRNRQGRALIGDPRNDENLFVSQVHGRRFIAEHNKLIDDGNMEFAEARETMIERYHTEIVEDFLPDVVNEDVLAPFLSWLKGDTPAPTDGNVTWDLIPDMPVEFSAAAYRFGHSMVRQSYVLKTNGDPEDIFNARLKGFSPVLTDDNLEMAMFFGGTAQKARKIDLKLPEALLLLPPEVVGEHGERNLAFRNMDRGQITFRLPSGEDFAQHLGIAPLPTHADVDAVGLAGHTPLWYYILYEAGENGGKLGPVGGKLVAGVLVNLMKKGNSPLAKPFLSS